MGPEKPNATEIENITFLNIYMEQHIYIYILHIQLYKPRTSIELTYSS